MREKTFYLYIFNVVCIVLLFTPSAYSQTNDAPRMKINHQAQTWLGLITTHRLVDNWGLVSDLIIRRDEFMSEPGFYFLRFGGGYWFNNNVSLTGAYGNIWAYRPQLKNKDFTTEYRFDQQLQVGSRLGKLDVVQRFRIESRWREIVQGDKTTGRAFSERLRYMYTFRLPISSNPSRPQLMLSNEILIQFGKQVVFNPLDQIRLFVGIRQSLGEGLSYDFGYFQIFHQTSAGNVYNANHALRLFVYFSTKRSKTNEAIMKME